MSRISPIDINSRMFKTSFRGFDTGEVDNFLGLVAEELEILTAENRMLRGRLAALEDKLEQFRKEEELIKRRMGEATAYRNKMMVEARAASDHILESVQSRAEQLESRIELMKREKQSLETYFTSFLKFNIELLKNWEKEPRG